MVIEAHERIENDAETTEWATKADFQNLALEVIRIQVGQKWIARILGVICSALVAIFCALVALALQI